MEEGYIQMPVDGAGKKVRTNKITILGSEVHSDVINVSDVNGNIINPATGDKQDSLNTELQKKLNENGNVNIANLPSDYAKESGNLASIKTNTDKLISAPATEAKQDSIQTELQKKVNEGGNLNVSNFPSDYAKESKQLPDNHNVTVSNPITGFSTSAKQDEAKGELQKLVGFEIPAYDYIEMSYDTNGNLTQTVYKQGGSSGTTVATLSMSYDANNNLTSVSKS